MDPLRFVIFLELELLVIIGIVGIVSWILYHYSFRTGYAKLSFQETPFNERVLSECSHIHSRYSATPWLPTGDFLSILATFFRSHPHPYRREQIMVDDGALLNLDWLEHEDAPLDTKVLVILPGITGHSKSGYLVHLVDKAYRAGWNVCVIVYPGTDMSPIQTARFIRAHVPHDLDHTLKHIHKNRPGAPIYAVGYSMGAAMLTNYLAMHGSDSYLSAAISCSNPFDVAYSVKRISTGVVNKLYNTHFLAALKQMYRRNESVFREAFPHIKPEQVAKFSSVEEYDSNLTMVHYGFNDLEEYYNALGCHTKVSKITVPFLVAHAEDDPIVSTDAVPIESIKNNPNVTLMITKTGGHTGWLQGINPLGPSWFDDVAFEWLSATYNYQAETGTLSPATSPQISKRPSRNRSPSIKDFNRKSGPVTRSAARNTDIFAEVDPSLQSSFTQDAAFERR